MSTVSDASRSPLHLRVFLASPGDVADERALALRVLEELQYDPLLRGRITVETVAWDKPGAGTPMLATLTPQEAIKQGLPTPAACDIVIVVFWARMGAPLPDEWKKPDGGRYRSGTEWEYLNALEAAERQGKPAVLVYRRTEKIALDPDDPDFDSKSQQWQQVKGFFQSFSNPDGSLRRGYNAYPAPEEFREQLNLHLRSLVREILERAAPVAAVQPVPSVLPAAGPSLWRGSPPPEPQPQPPQPPQPPVLFARLLSMLVLVILGGTGLYYLEREFYQTNITTSTAEADAKRQAAADEAKRQAEADAKRQAAVEETKRQAAADEAKRQAEAKLSSSPLSRIFTVGLRSRYRPCKNKLLRL